MMSKESAGGFGIGLLIGAVVGLAVGLLYAPRSGKETREQIKEQATEFMDRAKGKATEIRQTIGEKIAPQKE